MKGLILAAGRGERMRPLSDHTPKPLLPVRGRPLLEWHLLAMAAGGVSEVVINVAWLGQQIVDALGDGSRWGLSITWSREDLSPGHALETAGGIAKALPWLANDPADAFWVVSGDLFMPGFRYEQSVFEAFADGPPERDAHLWFVPNPSFHPSGDFGLAPNGRALAAPDPRTGDARTWTYANVALMRARLCADVPMDTVAKLAPLLKTGMDAGRITAEVWRGPWHNVGTPEQLAALQAHEPFGPEPLGAEPIRAEPGPSAAAPNWPSMPTPTPPPS